MYTYHMTVERVVDGDTIDALVDLGFEVLVKMRFRLAHINAPELHSKDPVEVINATKAKDRLTQLLFGPDPTAHDGTVVLIRSEKNIRTDKYGRWLANLTAVKPDGTEVNVNQTLIDEGLAVPYEGGKR